MKEVVPIFVTGNRRSGLSMVCSVLHLHGIWTGENEAKKFQKMSFVNRPVWNLLYEKLRVKGLDSRIKNEIGFVLYEQGFRGGYWLLKHYSLLEYFDDLNYFFPYCKWLFVRRDEEEVLNSCLKTHPLNRVKTETEWKEIIRKGEERMNSFKEKENVFEIHTNNFFKGDFSEIRAFVKDVLFLDWNFEVVKFLFRSLANGESNTRRSEENN